VMEPQPQPSGNGLRVPAVAIFLLLLFFTMGLVIFSFPAGAYAVYVGPLGNYTSSALFRPYLWVGPVLVPAGFNLIVGEAFAMLTLVYAVMLVFAAYQKRSMISAIRASFSEGVGALLSSPLIVLMVAIGFTISGGSLIDNLVSGAGAPIGTIQGDPLVLLLGFTLAPLVEEIGFRVVLIGIVAALLASNRPLKEVLRALWRPSSAYEGMAVGSGAAILIWAATGFSAVTFGACHVLCGSGWDWGKFFEAAFGGAVLGYLYVKHGLHIAVLTHWGVDYFGSVYSFYGQAAYGIPWDSNTREFIGQYLVDIDTILLFGVASLLLVAYVGITRFAKRKELQPSTPVPVGSS